MTSPTVWVIALIVTAGAGVRTPLAIGSAGVMTSTTASTTAAGTTATRTAATPGANAAARGQASTRPRASELRRLAAAMQRVSDLGEYRDVVEATLDIGDDAVPQLLQTIKGEDVARRSAAIAGLAYLGGDVAIATLDRELKAKPDELTRMFYCMALGSRGTPADRQLLMQTLQTKVDGSDGAPIVTAAAFALGVLRATEAAPALEQIAKQTPASSVSEAAATALARIRGGEVSVQTGGIAPPATGAMPATGAPPATGTAGPAPPTGAATAPATQTARDEVIAAVLRHGVPRAAEASEFADRDRGGVWVRQERAWSFRAGAAPSDFPSLDFRVHVSPDGTRALASVGIAFGPKGGSGYDYVLKKTADGWQVRGVLFTWIS